MDDNYDDGEWCCDCGGTVGVMVMVVVIIMVVIVSLVLLASRDVVMNEYVGVGTQI